jgi:DNA-binding MarR family transcriptional regulator
MTTDAQASAEECNCFAVRAAARHVSQCYDQFLAPTGLRTTQFSVLAKLKRKGPLTINALAEDMVMDRTTLGRNILPLERDGLIRIEPAASDRRAKELQLTGTGEKRLQAARKRWAAAQARFEATFGTKRAAELRALLRGVVASDFAPTDQGRDDVAARPHPPTK